MIHGGVFFGGTETPSTDKTSRSGQSNQQRPRLFYAGAFLIITFVLLTQMHISFLCLFYTPEARAQIDSGVDAKKFKQPEHVRYKQIGININRVETFLEAESFPNHTELTMYTGDTWVIKINYKDYARLIDHVDSGKLLCKMNN